MKKNESSLIYIIVIIAVLAGCKPPLLPSEPLEPPSWLWGEWSTIGIDPASTLEFTVSDVFKNGNSLYEFYNDKQIRDTSSDTRYTFSFIMSETFHYEYIWTKIDSTTIVESLFEDGSKIEEVTFHRQ